MPQPTFLATSEGSLASPGYDEERAKVMEGGRMPGGSTTSIHRNRDGRLPTSFGTCALALGILAGVTFLVFPEIDLVVSRLFYARHETFAGQSLGWVKVLRSSFVGGFYLCVAATIAGLAMTHGGARTWLRLTFRQWSFLTICLVMGPGLVANVVFKDHWGRARPKQIIEFGGAKIFTPPLLPTNQCGSNCSFISGEAASTFLPFYAASVLIPQSAPLLIAVGTLCGLAAGLVRIAQGAHFLSDVIFAGVFMALTVVLVQATVFGRRSSALPQRQGIEKAWLLP